MPVPDVTLATTLVGLSDARDYLQACEREIDDNLSGLFQRISVRESRTRTLSAGRRIRERVAAARLVDDLGFRVRTLFPHPIAYRWRAVEAAGPDRERYGATLDAAEVTLCYLAMMSLVQARALGYEVGYLRTVRERLATGRSGTNLGDWIAICREVRGARAIRRLADHTPFPELLESFNQDEEAEAAVDRLAQRRNDEAHGRGVESHRIGEEAAQAEADLRTVLAGVEFLADYPLRYVEVTRLDTLVRRLSYAYRDLVGDHPLIPLTQGATDSPEVEAGSLYLVSRGGGLHLVRPLLLRLQCPHCGSWATFHVDRFDRNEAGVVMKGLEHGHTVTRPDLTEPLRLVGMLVGD